MKRIKLGDYLEALIHVITLGFGQRLSEWIAIDLLGKESCGCCERKEWLNRLTDMSPLFQLPTNLNRNLLSSLDSYNSRELNLSN